MNEKMLRVVTVLSFVATSTQAGRPLATDDADTVPVREFELESGVVWHHDSNTENYHFPFGFATGLTAGLEAGLGFGGQIQERTEGTDTDTISGIGDLEVGLKWNPLRDGKGWASHAIAFNVKLPTASRNKDFGTGKTDFDLTYIASKSISEAWSAHFNAGFTWTGDPAAEAEDDLFHGGVALGRRTSEKLELVCEVFTDLPKGGGASEAVVECNGGLRWSLRGNLILDAAVGTRLHGDAPDLTASVGVTWTFSGAGK